MSEALSLDEKIAVAIENVVAMVRANVKPDDALKFSQAAKNLAEVKQIVKGPTKATAKGPAKKQASAS